MARPAKPSIRYYYKPKRARNGKDESQVLMVVSYNRKRLNINMGLPLKEIFKSSEYPALFNAINSDGYLKETTESTLNHESEFYEKAAQLSNFLLTTSMLNNGVLGTLVVNDYWQDITPADFMLLCTIAASAYAAGGEKKVMEFLKRKGQCEQLIETLKELRK